MACYKLAKVKILYHKINTRNQRAGMKRSMNVDKVERDVWERSVTVYQYKINGDAVTFTFQDSVDLKETNNLNIHVNVHFCHCSNLLTLSNATLDSMSLLV